MGSIVTLFSSCLAPFLGTYVSSDVLLHISALPSSSQGYQVRAVIGQSGQKCFKELHAEVLERFIAGAPRTSLAKTFSCQGPRLGFKANFLLSPAQESAPQERGYGQGKIHQVLEESVYTLRGQTLTTDHYETRFYQSGRSQKFTTVVSKKFHKMGSGVDFSPLALTAFRQKNCPQMPATFFEAWSLEDMKRQ